MMLEQLQESCALIIASRDLVFTSDTAIDLYWDTKMSAEFKGQRLFESSRRIPSQVPLQSRT